MRNWIITLGLVALSALAANVMLMETVSLERRNADWIERAEKQSQNSATDRLFKSAVAANLIRYDIETDELQMMTPREGRAIFGSDEALPAPTERQVELRQETSFDANEARLFDPATALDLLWKSRGPGAEVRAIIDDFVGNRSLLAVRDAGLTQACRVMAEEECPQALWTIHLSLANLDDDVQLSAEEAMLAAPTSAMRTAAPDVAVFSALARGVSQPFGNWSMASGREIANETFILRPDVPPGQAGRPAVIDVIGANVRAPLGAQVEYFCFSEALETTLRLTSCDAQVGSVAARIKLPQQDTAAPPSLSATPIRVPLLPPAMRQSLLSSNEDRETGGATTSRIRLDDRLSLVCDMQKAQCDPVLATTQRRVRLARDLQLRDRIETAALEPDATEDTQTVQNDAEDALGPDAVFETQFLRLVGPNSYEVTDLTRSLDLIPAVGVPGVSFGSYLGFLENLPSGVEAEDLRLTFEPTLQGVTRDVLRDFLEGGDFPAQQNRLIDGQEDNRRAALVLVDLADGPDQGAVRAVAGYPFFTATDNLWDLQARARESEGASTISAAAWRGLDARFQPGSSMKILSALSLARTAAGVNEGIDPSTRSQLETALVGAPPSFYNDAFDLDVTQTSQRITSSRVSGSGTFQFGDRGAPVYPAPQATSQACGRDASTLYGVCEALARSSNIYFAILALHENENALDALYGTQSDNPVFTGLGQTLTALGLAGARPLVRLPPTIDAATTFAPDVEAARLDSAPGLAGGTLRPDPMGLHELNVAINAYGQNAFVTPLSMATTAGAIGLGHTIAPFIARTEDAQPPRKAPLLPSDTRSQQLLDEIREGMSAVMAPRGTGYAGFRAPGPTADALRARVHAKTGTAEIGSTDGTAMYTHWFVGWIENTQGTPKYAFACAVSHVRGGSPCATVVGEWMHRLDASGALQ